MMILVGRPVVYRNALSGLRISAVDGTAFLDACAALVPYADGSHLVEIYDASGRMLRGYLGAAGTGETYGSPLGNNMSFATWTGDNPDDWLLTGESGGNEISEVGTTEGHGGAGTGSCNFYTTGNDINIRQASLVVVGGVMHFTTVVSAVIAGGAKLTDGFTTYATYTTTGTKTVLATGTTGTTLYVQRSEVGAANDVTIDSIVSKQVLTPSADGATIVSAKGGATQNFAYKNAAFTYNAASYHVIVKKVR